MRILTRYILREVTAHALIGVAVFTFVLFTRDLGHILELVVRNSAPLPSVAEVFFFIVPVTLTISIPAGVLVGILIGLSRLAADSEITAMRASGIGIWSFLRIVSIFAVTAWILALFNGLYVAPQSQAAMVHLQDHLKSSQASFEVQPRVFYEGFPGLVLYVQNVKAAQGAAIWKGVFIVTTRFLRLNRRTSPSPFLKLRAPKNRSQPQFHKWQPGNCGGRQSIRKIQL